MPGISIIIPCFHNNLKNFANTQRCIESVKKNTKLPYDLIVVENLERWLSGEGTVYVGSAHPKTYAENVNLGLRLSQSEYSVVLNNDACVPDGWIEAMLDCFKLKDCGVATLDSMQFGREPKDEIIEQFFGAVWMVSREVVNKVGYLDEQFVHAFDDADYWVRVYEAGYKIYMNRNKAIEHKGGATIYGFEGHDERFSNMRKLFNKKHEGCALEIFAKLR